MCQSALPHESCYGKLDPRLSLGTSVLECCRSLSSTSIRINVHRLTLDREASHFPRYRRHSDSNRAVRITRAGVQKVADLSPVLSHEDARIREVRAILIVLDLLIHEVPFPMAGLSFYMWQLCRNGFILLSPTPGAICLRFGGFGSKAGVQVTLLWSSHYNFDG